MNELLTYFKTLPEFNNYINDDICNIYKNNIYETFDVDTILNNKFSIIVLHSLTHAILQ